MAEKNRSTISVCRVLSQREDTGKLAQGTANGTMKHVDERGE